MKREDIKESSYQYTRVCSVHFISGKPSTLYDSTNPDWVPSLNLGHSQSLYTPASTTRYMRAQERGSKRRRIAFEEQLLREEAEVENADTNCTENVNDKEVQTDLKLSEMLEEHDRHITHLREEVCNNRITFESFEKDDVKTLYYTGLPNWEVFSVLFDFVKSDLSHKSSLAPFQQVMMTLMRLRHNFPFQDIGYRFSIHASTASRLFNHVIDVLFVKLKPLITWPERDILLSTMPMCFRKHCPKCTVIIDCFEIFLERPTNLLARAQTFSSYKHHNTVKYLIGVTPQGTISYISSGWGGRVSDKHLTENCGLLNNLLPGDVILADRGFDIQETVAAWAVKVRIPAFTKGKKQLAGIDVEQTRRIANVRIHVERVIGLLRQKYSILSSTQPIDAVQCKGTNTPMLDKIVITCSALINLCDSVIPFD